MPEPVTESHRSKPRRYYSDREKAEALAIYDACGSLTETSKACGIADSTLSQWVRGNQGVSSPDIPLLRNGIQINSQQLAERFDRIALLATGHVISRLENQQRANKTPIPHLMTAAGISVDKSQLLKGQPTSIVENVESHQVLVILADALGEAINVTPAPCGSEGIGPQEQIAEVPQNQEDTNP